MYTLKDFIMAVDLYKEAKHDFDQNWYYGGMYNHELQNRLNTSETYLNDVFEKLVTKVVIERERDKES